MGFSWMSRNLWKQTQSFLQAGLPRLNWPAWPKAIFKRPTWYDLLDGVVKFFSVCAALIALLALGLAFIWLVVFWYTPKENYNISRVIETAEGRCLRVEYPKLILANDKPANLTITVRCRVSPPETIKITFPNELRPSDEPDIASQRIMPIKFYVESPDLPQTNTVTVVNSRTSKRAIIYYSAGSKVVLTSKLLSKPEIIEIYVETTTWAQLREFVNSSADEKNALFLFISGVIPGVIAYFLQLQKDTEQKRKEFYDNYRKELLEGFQANPVLVMRRLVEDCRKGATKDFSSAYTQLERAGFHDVLPKRVFSLWQSESFQVADLIIEDISYLEGEFPNRLFVGEARWLEQIKEMIDNPENLEILPSEIIHQKINSILDAFARWGDITTPSLLPLLRRLANLPSCWHALYDVFYLRNGRTHPLLVHAQVNDIMTNYYMTHRNKLTPSEATDYVQLRTCLGDEIIWQPVWQNQKVNISSKLNRWLISHGCDPERSSFGSELVELDTDFDRHKVNHPILEQIDKRDSMLVFGESGSGKTATAYYILTNCIQRRYSDVFPVYALYQDTIAIKDWLINSMARSLISFISDNPYLFLNAKLSQKIAMGVLMLRYAGTLDSLRINFRISGGISNEVLAQILDQLQAERLLALGENTNPFDVFEILHMARPEGFSRTYFILDVSTVSRSRKGIISIIKLVDLVLGLTRSDFSLKAFLPMDLKSQFGKTLIESLAQELTWDDVMLRGMLETRFDKFAAVCDRRTVGDPYGLIVEASHGSPREAIRFGNALMRYAEIQLNEFEKLNKDAFFSVRDALIARGALSDSGGAI
jgi:hypothetical protein